MSYCVESFYDSDMDFVSIRPATPEDIERDGDNWVGSCDAYRTNCYETLGEAIENAGFWPTAIGFSSDFSNKERAEILNKVNELLKSPEFVARFGLNRSVIESDLSINDIMFEEERETER